MSKLAAIDTHVHFWEMESYRPFSQWFRDREYLQRDYLPADLEPDLACCNVEGVIIVGAAPDSDDHNQWCGKLVEQYDHVAGLVGSYTFENDQLTRSLDLFADKAWFLGIRARPVLPADQWHNDPVADRGMAHLKQRNLTLDILVDHTLLGAVGKFAAKHDDIPFVLNHCGLPPFASGDLSHWRQSMRSLAAQPNIHVKYSSFFLHCHPDYAREPLQHAADTLFESFGVERLMWGSNWPPELIGGTYREAYRCMLACAGDLSDSEYNKIFRENAQQIYGIDS